LLECGTDKVVRSIKSDSDGTFVMEGLMLGRILDGKTYYNMTIN